jgi:hypothetical protein
MTTLSAATRARPPVGIRTVAAAVGTLAITLLPTAADADAHRHRGGYHGPVETVVVAESRFGNGTVTGPVRVTAKGRQVRLPGGTWEYCRRSCSETLRVSTVDFWESPNAGGGGITNECGIFGCLELRFPRY